MEVINHHTALAEQVMKTLLYFDIFSYPLKSGEVFNYLHIGGTTHGEVKECLDDLVEKKQLFRFGDFYSLHAEEKIINRRIKGNFEADKWLKVARKQGQFIARFPYVRAVMASGSLSKGYMDEKSDLDFFIVTTPNRLWIARTLLVLYKRAFLFNSHRKFCVNYFVDTQHLEIEEKNLFTATEIVTLIPLHNRECYDSMIDSNRWLKEFLPNFSRRHRQDIHEKSDPAARRFFEFLLNPISRPLDKFFMRLSLGRWEKLYGEKFDKRDFDIAFKTRPHVSKNHPNNYQKKILELYANKVNEYTRQSGRA